MRKKSALLLFLLALLMRQAEAQTKVAPAWPGVPYKTARVFVYNLDNQLHERYHAWKDGKPNFTLVQPGTSLDAQQLKELDLILNSDTRILNEGLAKCYEPHHAVFFYDENEKVVAAFDVCFLCEGIRFYPAKQYKSEVKHYTDALTKKAQQQLEQIKHVFTVAGVPVFDSETAVNQYTQRYTSTDTLEIRSDSLVQHLLKTFDSKSEIIQATGQPSLEIDSVYTDDTRAIPLSYFQGKGHGILLSYRVGQDYQITHLETTIKTGFFNNKLNVGSTRTEVNRLVFPFTGKYTYHTTIAIRGKRGKSVFFIHFNQRKTVDHITYNFN